MQRYIIRMAIESIVYYAGPLDRFRNVVCYTIDNATLFSSAEQAQQIAERITTPKVKQIRVEPYEYTHSLFAE